MIWTHKLPLISADSAGYTYTLAGGNEGDLGMSLIKSSAVGIILLILLILVLQVGAGFFIYNSFDSWSERGTFGDMFGAVNALFSGLALAGVIYAILLQRAELALQRQELELTREELARSASAQEQSAQLIAEQLAIARSSAVQAEATSLAQTALFIHLIGVKTSVNQYTLGVSNVGAIARDLEAIPEGSFEVILNFRAIFPAGSDGHITVRGIGDLQPPFFFRLQYRDSVGRQRTARYLYNPELEGLREIAEQS